MKVIIPLAGKGTRLRPHTHVTPKPMMRVAGKPVMSYVLDELRDLGGVEEVSMEELARRIIDVAGSDSKIRYIPYDEAYEEGFEDMQRRVPDTTRAKELVGFEPTVDLDGIIRSVVADQRR